MKRILFFGFIVLFFAGCSLKVPSPKAPNMGAVAISVSGSLCGGFSQCYNQKLMLAQVSSDEEPLSQGRIFESSIRLSHATTSDDYYLFNLPAGRYALIGFSKFEELSAFLPTEIGGEHLYYNFLSGEDVRQTLIDVLPGKIVHLGNVQMNHEGMTDSVITDSQDTVIQHNYRQIFPEGAPSSPFDHLRKAVLEEIDRTEGATIEFQERAREELGVMEWEL